MHTFFLAFWIFYTYYTNSCTFMVANVFFFHRVMSLEVQSCFNLNGRNRKKTGHSKRKKVLLFEKLLKLLFQSR